MGVRGDFGRDVWFPGSCLLSCFVVLVCFLGFFGGVWVVLCVSLCVCVCVCVWVGAP